MPLPPVSGPNDRALIPHGYIWQQYEAGLKDAYDPNTPTWARWVLGGLSVVAAPAAGLEEYVGRALLNIPYLVDNAGTSSGEHFARGYMLREQAEQGTATIRARASRGWANTLMVLLASRWASSQWPRWWSPMPPRRARPYPVPPSRGSNAPGRSYAHSTTITVADCRSLVPGYLNSWSIMPNTPSWPTHVPGLRAAGGYSPKLTYAGDQALARLNRADATRGIPRLLSRDEYPFASTLEGGRSTWIGHIPASQNSSQGGLLGGFYRRYGMRRGDQFTVKVVNHPGLP